jgi:pseudouridine-5'-phosphate glycosidase
MLKSSVHNEKLAEVLVFTPEVQDALATGRPVVALESTIISHGMPYPRNIETAQGLEKIIRDEGAVPATIAVMDGKIKIGLNAAELEILGRSNSVRKILKLSRRDIPYALSSRSLGATTVAATMICAELAGIHIFATGGIGGVHRGAETTFDISADLPELARSRVAVVCAGAKSILDIGLTLEVLETLGVPVIGYQTDVFPAFYSRDSSFPIECRIDQVTEIAALLKTQWMLGYSGGALVANPVPQENEFPSAVIETHIEAALDSATEENIKGKAVTPFLLSYLAEKTAGKSLETNIALVRNNARLGAQLAKAMC